LRAERAYLRVLEGGCSIPVFALAAKGNNGLKLKGGIVSLDGQKRIFFEVEGAVTDPEGLGEKLAEKVFQAGGKEILEKIKSNLNQ